MAGVLFGVCVVFVILMTDEILWRLKLLRGEPSRQLVHILVGSFIAFWPFLMSFEAIQLLALAMLVVITISRKYKIFQGIHAVKRRTYGEYFFPISVGIAALVTDSKAIFAASILHLSLADGLAAWLGSRHGDKTRYRVFGQNKSWFGTLTFLAVSICIIGGVAFTQMDHFIYANVWLLALLPILTAGLESIAVYGTDDLVVPLVVLFALKSLSTFG